MSATKRSLQIAAFGDLTASMASIRGQIRRTIETEATKIAISFPNLEFSVGFFGDDANDEEIYSIRNTPLTANIGEVTSFIQATPNAYGGGPHANYELAFATANQLKWRDDAEKIFLLFGDEVPHSKGFRLLNGSSYDWRRELGGLIRKGVYVCGVHCLRAYRSEQTRFYEEVAELSGGSYLTLPQFTEVNNLLLAVAYQKMGIDHLRGFRGELASRHELTRNLDANINRLANGGIPVDQRYAAGRKDGLVPVTPGTLLRIVATENIDLPVLVEQNGFSEGHKVKRYYELIKSETIQGNKAVILEEKDTGDLLEGDGARRLLNLPVGAINTDVSLSPTKVKKICPQYRVFVESHAFNRAIKPGQSILISTTERTVRRPRKS